MHSIRHAITALAAALLVLLAGSSAAFGASGRAYVLTSSPSAVTIVDVATAALVKSVPLAAEGRIAVSADGSRAYVAQQAPPTGAVSVAVIDTATATLVTTITGNLGHNARGIAISPDGKRVYVASESAGLPVIDTATNVIAHFDYNGFLIDVQASPDGKLVYWTEQTSDRPAPGFLVIADAVTGVVQKRITVPTPGRLRLTPDGTRAYVADAASIASYSVVDLTTGTVLPPITAGALAFSPDSTRLYDARPGTLDFRVTATGASLGMAPISQTPGGIGATLDGTRVVVTDGAEGTVSFFDAATRTGAGSVPVGGTAYEVAIGPGPAGPSPAPDPVVARNDAPPSNAPQAAPNIAASSAPEDPTPRAQPGCPLSGTVFVGTAGNDVRSGAASTDVLFGLGGADRLSGRGGRDCLYGEDGSDILSGESGSDRLFGGSGGDRMTGGWGDDRLDGGTGPDTLAGGLGNDRLRGEAGADRLSDARGHDSFAGGGGGDRIDSRDATLSGRRGSDSVSCGSGRDIVFADRTDRVARDCERVTRR